MPYENKYSEYCSHKCQLQSAECRAKAKATKIAKYGEDNIVNTEKARKTRLERYGAYHPEGYAEKVKATKLERYGDENYVNAAKLHETFSNRKIADPDFYAKRLEKSRLTNIANGHCPDWNNRDKFKQTLSGFSAEKKTGIADKRKATCLMKYNAAFPMQNASIRRKTKDTLLLKYGVSSLLSLPAARESCSVVIREKAWDMLMSSNCGIEPVISKSEFLSSNFDVNKTPVKWRCKTCGHEFMHVWRNWNRKCPKCFPQNFRIMQNEVADFIERICIGHEVIRDSKSVLSGFRQLDIFIKSLNTAIEFNGVFWHNSDIGVYGRSPIPRNYHQNKTAECAAKGIRLIHIFEDEWTCHRKLCKSKLRKLLRPGVVRKIPAEDCIVDLGISQGFKEKFIGKYTFYGQNDGSSWQCALRHNGHVIAMLTAAKSRNDKRHEWQIMNYAEINSAIVVNGFKVLLDAFINAVNPESVCMNMSSDWNTPEDFSGCMDFTDMKGPRLYWAHDGIRVNGTSITPANAKAKLLEYDNAKMFRENMNANKYYRIYDSGMMQFELALHHNSDKLAVND